MSYDLYFLRREPGQSWDDALEAQEEQEEPAPFDTKVWDSVVSQAREVLGDITIFENPPAREISHEPTGIQLSCFEGQWGLTVPYWTHDEDAADIVAKLRTLASIVERETGLACYDPQLGRPLSETQRSDAASSVAMFNQVAEQFGRR